MERERDVRMVRLTLTDEQKNQVQESTGLATEAIELTPQELEERITPRIALNHNETMLG